LDRSRRRLSFRVAALCGAQREASNTVWRPLGERRWSSRRYRPGRRATASLEHRATRPLARSCSVSPSACCGNLGDEDRDAAERADREADTPDELLELALRQLDDGADFIKLYLDGPDPETAPWTVSDVERVVEAAHERGAKVTAHAGRLSGTRVCAEAGVDCIEHGFEIDEACARLMAEKQVALVSTLAVLKSWMSFGHTTTIERFTSKGGRDAIARRWEEALRSIRVAHAAGVLIGAGTDVGGGSARANQMAWEVEALVEAGLEPWEALAAATWKAGQILDEPDAGQLREGGPADFFLVHGDPLSDPSALWRVWRIAWVDASI
jgi:imidazolonepropionase-like amidohydrolase